MTEVTDKMVEAAIEAYWDVDSYDHELSQMLAAIAAALAARDPVKSVELVRSLRKWSGVLAIPSGDFVNIDCGAAADAIEELVEALKRMSYANPPWNDYQNARDLLTRMGVKL